MISADNKRIAKNTMFLYIRMFVLILVAFYTTRVVLQALGVDDFGLYNVVAGFVAMVTFINQSLTNSIQRFFNVEIGKGTTETLNKCFGVSLFVQLIISGILLVLAETVGLWFVNTKLNIPANDYFAANVVYQTSIFSILLRIIQSPFGALIIAKEKMQFYAIISLLEAFAQLSIVYVLMTLEKHRLEAYGILLLLVTAIIVICNIIYCKRIVKSLKVKVLYDQSYFRDLISFCGWNLWGSGSGVIKSQGINVIMNMFFGVAINAARGIAFQVLSGVIRFSSSFQVAMNPQIIQSYAQGDMKRYFTLSYTCSKISLYFMWLLVLPIIVCVDKILEIWLGADVPEYSGLFVQIILLTGVIDSLASAISTPIYATGNIKRYQVEVSLIILLILPISWILYKMGMPPESSMWASLVLSVFAQISRVKIWCHLVKESTFRYLKEVVLPGLAVLGISSILCYVLKSLLSENVIALITIILSSILINICLIFLLGFNRNEKQIIITVIKQKLNIKK